LSSSNFLLLLFFFLLLLLLLNNDNNKNNNKNNNNRANFYSATIRIFRYFSLYYEKCYFFQEFYIYCYVHRNNSMK